MEDLAVHEELPGVQDLEVVPGAVEGVGSNVPGQTAVMRGEIRNRAL